MKWGTEVVTGSSQPQRIETWTKEMNSCIKTVLYFSRWICMLSHLIPVIFQGPLLEFWQTRVCHQRRFFDLVLLGRALVADGVSGLHFWHNKDNFLKTNFTVTRSAMIKVNTRLLSQVCRCSWVLCVIFLMVCTVSWGEWRKKCCISFRFLEKHIYEEGNYLHVSFSCCRFLLFW